MLDTSALIALLKEEAEAALFRALIARASVRLVSAGTHFEASMAALSRRGEPGVLELQAILDAVPIEMVPVEAEHARRALDAFRRFGRGRHPGSAEFRGPLLLRTG